MSGRGLSRQLLGIGRAAGRGAPGGRLRFVALLLAAAALTAVAAAAVGAAAMYHGRDVRDRARGPVPATARHPATVLWSDLDEAAGDVPHWIVYVEPLTPDAAPPPGVRAWPAPGEVLLSPALAAAGDGVRERYGRYAGTIGAAGLASPAERLAYVRPRHPPAGAERRSWDAAAGFGRAYGLGEAQDPEPLPMLLLALGGLAGVPALALATVAARCGSATRDRRTDLLRALGARRRHRALIDVGEAAPPVLAGTALGLPPVATALAVPVRLPITGYVLAPGDLRAAWPLLAAAVAAAPALLLALVVALAPAAPGGGTRPRRFAERVPRRRLAACGAAFAAVAGSQYLGGRTGLVVFSLGTLGLWAAAPSLGAMLSGRLGRSLARLGRRAGPPGLLIGGRWTAAHPGVVVRLAAATAIGLGLIVQLQVWTSRLNDEAAAAHATRDRIGAAVLTVDAGAFDPAAVRAFTARLPAGSRVLTLTEGGTGPDVIAGGCADLRRALRLPCTAAPAALPLDGDPRVQELRKWYGENGIAARTAPARARPPDALLVVADRAAPDQERRVKRAAFAALPAPRVQTLGETWILGVDRYVRTGRWLLLFGSCGLALLLAAAGVGAAAEFLRFGPALAPVAVLTGRTRVFHAVAWWHLSVPLLVTTLVGGAVTAWDGLLFVSVVRDGHLDWGVLAAAMAGCAAAAVAVGAGGGLAAARAARRWRPVAD
ncbi:hypothetical protein [Actinomadura parmotrematis]|uniref:Permease n=1 Tax=Actinomadura parmotrematis TaxID=2864039 RepID=A0ABS7FLP6_9ACTN|nr:hypothetical protein [Actinomadura parmotrematis]MBW8481281.1 hypothetical protein [Actinomadura parmotrematis]